MCVEKNYYRSLRKEKNIKQIKVLQSDNVNLNQKMVAMHIINYIHINQSSMKYITFEKVESKF